MEKPVLIIYTNILQILKSNRIVSTDRDYIYKFIQIKV
jgi:hypothetical protein